MSVITISEQENIGLWTPDWLERIYLEMGWPVFLIGGIVALLVIKKVVKR